MPPTVRPLFVTSLYRAEFAAPDEPLIGELQTACLALAQEDLAGRAWRRAHRYPGYTSYASLDDLPRRDPAFAELKRRLDRHAAAFAQAAAFELKGRRLKLDSLWVNVLEPRGWHGAHIHPLSVVSGTAYVAMAPGAGAIRFEDPRLPLMMAAPPRRADAPEPARTFVSFTPEAGEVLMWESWLRHEVAPGAGKGRRISVSFNYRW